MLIATFALLVFSHCSFLSVFCLVSLMIRVAPDLIFQIRPGPDLAGFGIADPAGAVVGAECS